MKVLVFGANGPTGREITRQALVAGHSVTAITRHPDALTVRHARLTILEGDATDGPTVDAAVDGQDAVLSALGVPYSRDPVSLYSISARSIVAAMSRHGVGRFIGLTSANVDPTSRTHASFLVDHVIEPVLSRIGRTVYEDMSRMEQVVSTSGLDWTIVRPPALCDADEVGAYRAADEPLAGTFASRADVAAFLVAQLADGGFSGKVAWIVSPDAHPNLLKIIWKDGIAKRS